MLLTNTALRARIALLASTVALLTACSTAPQGIYLDPPLAGAKTRFTVTSASGPHRIRLETDYIHNGERQGEPGIPFSPQAREVLEGSGAFTVVTDADAPLLKLTLISHVDREEASRATWKASLTLGQTEFHFARDFTLTAELDDGMRRQVQTTATQRYLATNSRDMVPAGSPPLGIVTGHQYAYEALLRAVTRDLVAQLEGAAL